MSGQQLQIEIVYASLDRQTLTIIHVSPNTSVEMAIHQSGILQDYPEIDLTIHKVGIFATLVMLNTCLKDHDRVEIYRPLQCDPKQARQRRADKKSER